MDHVDLTPYPFPEGIAVPRLMPFQEYPWNNDGYLAAEVLRLRDKHGLTKAFETGTCLGSTTLWLHEHFQHTDTVEVHRPFFDLAVARFIHVVGRHVRDDVGSTQVWIGGHGDEPSINAWNGDSAGTIYRLGRNVTSGTLFFLDAHWGDVCPLLNELDAIASAGIRPCIVIHDFQVPGTDFGFDRFPDSGYPFNLEAIAMRLDAIYGVGKWVHNYPTKVEGARRGWVSIEPVK